MENETSPQQNSWLSDFSWRQAVIYIALSMIAGGSTGAGLVATSAVKAQGMNQDQADVRYLTLTEADRRAGKRDMQNERIEQKIDDIAKKLDEKFVRKELYDQNNEGIKVLLNQILQAQRENYAGNR